ncbi:MAG: hypothetical protein FJ304_10645 [Planctomycetes bacterium]|nr:hypothetical protein [Planctomycetota bacterium]
MTYKALTAAVFGLGLLWATGCGKKDESSAAKPDPKPAPKKGVSEDHTHGTGPNGGVVFDFGGGKYHGEFKPDHKKKEATVWILGLDAKTAVPLKVAKLRLVIANTTPKIELDLLAVNPDKDGKAHEFRGTSDGLAVEKEYEGTVTFTLDGKQYNGDFEEEPEPKKK